jgi:hypothetical protein
MCLTPDPTPATRSPPASPLSVPDTFAPFEFALGRSKMRQEHANQPPEGDGAMIGLDEFRRNQSRYPPEELAKSNGQYVAWSPDGTQIVAADPDPIRLDALLRASGYDPAEILVSRVAIPEEVSWDGWSVPEDPGKP